MKPPFVFWRFNNSWGRALPSWEPPSPIPRHFWRWFPFPRWVLLVPWRAIKKTAELQLRDLSSGSIWTAHEMCLHFQIWSTFKRSLGNVSKKKRKNYERLKGNDKKTWSWQRRPHLPVISTMVSGPKRLESLCRRTLPQELTKKWPLVGSMTRFP